MGICRCFFKFLCFIPLIMGIVCGFLWRRFCLCKKDDEQLLSTTDGDHTEYTNLPHVNLQSILKVLSSLCRKTKKTVQKIYSYALNLNFDLLPSVNSQTDIFDYQIRKNRKFQITNQSSRENVSRQNVTQAYGERQVHSGYENSGYYNTFPEGAQAPKEEFIQKFGISEIPKHDLQSKIEKQQQESLDAIKKNEQIRQSTEEEENLCSIDLNKTHQNPEEEEEEEKKDKYLVYGDRERQQVEEPGCSTQSIKIFNAEKEVGEKGQTQEEEEKEGKEQAKNKEIEKNDSPLENALFKVKQIKESVQDIENQVHTFSGSKEDKTFLHLKEMLIKHVLKLDDIETEGNNIIRLERKETIKYAHSVLETLTSKCQ